MTDFRGDSAEFEALEPEMREAVEAAMRGQSVVAEFTVGTMFEGRSALTEEEREVAVALNTLGEILSRRARAASKAGEPKWEGLADAETMTYNELARRRLPQLIRSTFRDEQDDGD